MSPQNLFSPEKKQLQIGFLALTDCAILVAAQERGLYEKYGLQVELRRETSWANIRDRVAVGELDAAHMLAPMPLAATLGIDGLGIPMETAFSMGLNGSAITLSTDLMTEMQTLSPNLYEQSPLKAHTLKQLIDTTSDRKLTFAHVYPFSQHYYLLRAWLTDAGIDPDKDITLRAIPPSQMVNQLNIGLIDGYCVGEPWNQIAVQQGTGQIAVSSYELWNNGPEKVLGVTQKWAEKYPQTHQALIASLLEAAQWLEHPHSRLKIANWLAKPEYLGIPQEQIQPPLVGHCRYAKNQPKRFVPDFNCFFRYAANAPWQSQGRFFIQQMAYSGQLTINDRDSNKDQAIIEQVYRMDRFNAVAEQIGLPHPLNQIKQEGIHQSTWVLTDASEPIAMGSSMIALESLATTII